MLLTDAVGDHANFVFFGEAGCGKSEIAVNLALALAAAGERPVRFFDLDMSRFRDVIDINIMGTVIPTKVFAPDMIRAGGGSIVNFASMNTYRPLSRVPAYACAKAAVSNWTQWIAAYLAPAGIRVNAIAPGFFVNERSRKRLMTPDGGLTPRGEHIHYNTPMHRFGQAEELLGCLNWLIDDAKAGFVTGITVPVDGGFLCSAGL